MSRRPPAKMRQLGDQALDAPGGPSPVAVVMCHDRFPFRYSKVLLRAPGRPTKRRPRGRVLGPASRPRPSRGRADAAPRRICAAPSTSLPRRWASARRRAPAARQGRAARVLGTRGRGHLPASAAPPARSVPLGICAALRRRGAADKAARLAVGSRAWLGGAGPRPRLRLAASDVRIRPRPSPRRARRQGRVRARRACRAVSGRPAPSTAEPESRRERRPRRAARTTTPRFNHGALTQRQGRFWARRRKRRPALDFFSRVVDTRFRSKLQGRSFRS